MAVNAIMRLTTGIVYVRGVLVPSGATLTFGPLSITSAAVTSTVPILLANGTAAAPGLVFTAGSTTGWFSSSAAAWDWAISGVSFIRINGDIVLRSTSALTWGSSGIDSVDLVIVREALGHSFQRNSTNAQRASWANTYASTISYESGSADWQTVANVFMFGTRTAATGTGRPLRLVAQASSAGTIGYLELAPSTGAITATGAVVSLAGVAAEGLVGVPVVAKVGRITAQSSNATIATLTTPAVDGSYYVSANMNVTASTTLVTTLTCTYTDESNTARTMILPVAGLTGSFVALGAISGAGATVWHTTPMHIRVKASTAITILTSAGTFTGVTYTADGLILQAK